jgi:hypothetical protein
LESLVSLGCSNQVHLHGLKTLVDNPVLKPENLEVLGEGCHPVVREVSVEVMLLHVQLDVLVKGVIAAVPFVLEGLELTKDSSSASDRFGSTEELGM